MGDNHLKIDNLKPLSIGNRRKIKKMKCYEMYIFYNNRGEIIEEEIIRELKPKVIKSKHFNYKWNGTLPISNKISKVDLNNQVLNQNYNKQKLMKTVLSRNRTITRITPFSLSHNNDIRRSPTNYNINENFQTLKKSLSLNKYYQYNINKLKSASHTNDPVKIMYNDKQNKPNKNKYGKYPKTYVKTSIDSIADEKTENIEKNETKNLSQLMPPSAIPYNNNRLMQAKLNNNVILDKDIPMKEEISDENCQKIQTFAKSFGIINVQDWVHNNCFLVKLYIPNATCSQINHLIDSCYNKKNI
ncbi:Hypothetical protein SRAE_X000191000 [Strongyloides ratti]|uniref:aECM cysteine-cradle domain-containing protein n=1 Tax=Strongyloides ratti TaxID=34506 RepID=A0A090KS17_STRRB|nr:Hypothetical protein SRAE_X000191000 [Strongyloides ratti]CEF60170.1 Hypothetical protein SRAE_X000191000 [Strongyloides ratti]